MKITYKKVTTIDMAEKSLNEYGMLGWDMCAVVGNSFYFKRVVDEVAEAPQQTTAPVKGKHGTKDSK